MQFSPFRSCESKLSLTLAELLWIVYVYTRNIIFRKYYLAEPISAHKYTENLK